MDIATANPNWMAIATTLITAIATIGTGVWQIKAQNSKPKVKPPASSQSEPVTYPFNKDDWIVVFCIVASLLGFFGYAIYVPLSKEFVVLECVLMGCLVWSLTLLFVRWFVWSMAVATLRDAEAAFASTLRRAGSPPSHPLPHTAVLPTKAAHVKATSGKAPDSPQSESQ